MSPILVLHTAVQYCCKREFVILLDRSPLSTFFADSLCRKVHLHGNEGVYYNRSLDAILFQRDCGLQFPVRSRSLLLLLKEKGYRTAWSAVTSQARHDKNRCQDHLVHCGTQVTETGSTDIPQYIVGEPPQLAYV